MGNSGARTRVVWIDTEFTSITEPYLISVGLVDDAGRELYVEAAGITPAICSPFVIAEVLPLLTGPKMQPIEMAAQIADFFRPYNRSLLGPLMDAEPDVILFSDAPRYDIELIKPFLPAKLRWKMAVPSFDDDVAEAAYRLEKEAAFAGGLRRHHALDDAHAIRRAWQSLST
jgi:hypothetical protein